MTTQDPLSRRDVGILHSIVESYLQTGEPVASLALSRVSRTSLSSASIRNIMAELSDQGFLSQPHTSAGRVPTQKAIQAYVKSLAVRVVSAELARMRTELRRAQTIESRVERSSQILTELTRNVGIVAAIPGEGQVLDRVELVALPVGKVLMIVVTNDGRVRNQIIDSSESIPGGELASIRNYLNENFSGWTLNAIRAELARRLETESAAYDFVLGRLMHLHMRGLLDIALDPDVHLGGTSNLVGIDLHITREAMRELFRTLEEKKRLLDILERFVAQDSEQPDIQVGLEEIHPALAGLALVGGAVHLPNGMSTKVAVLGPMRMDYSRALSAVAHMQQAMRSVPA